MGHEDGNGWTGGNEQGGDAAGLVLQGGNDEGHGYGRAQYP